MASEVNSALSTLRIAALGVALLASGALAADRPNIVYLLAADLGAHDLGFRGGTVRTPTLDAMAAGGAILNAFYVQPYSSQTRAALLTGRYPMRYGLQSMSITRASGYGLPVEERTLAQALKDEGYRTAFVGDWLLGHAKPEYWPTRRGFDMFYGSLAGTSESSIHKATKTDWRRGDKAVNDTGYVTQLLATEAVRIIERHEPSSPLFLMVSFNAPARYQDVPPALRESYSDIASDSRRNYAAAVTALDSAVGEIVTALERRKLLDNTLIVFHSDNGGALPTRYPTGDRDVRNAAADNGSLREGHGSLYEGAMRIPSIVSWRGRIAPKTIVTDPLHITDLHATLLRLAGAAPDPDRPLDGVDVWPVITERKLSTRRDMLLDVEDFRGAIRAGEWKLIVHAALPAKVELFDIANDPEEADNKAATYPDRVGDLLGRLNAYAYDMAPSLYLEAFSPALSPALWRANPPRR